MERFVNVKGTNYIRDTKTMALINNDPSGCLYEQQLNKISKEKNEINIVQSEIKSIKNDMDEIKKIMLQLLNKGSDN